MKSSATSKVGSRAESAAEVLLPGRLNLQCVHAEHACRVVHGLELLLGVGVGAGFQENRDNLSSSIDGGQHEGSPAQGVAVLYTCLASFQEFLHLLGIALLHSAEELVAISIT